MKRFLKEVTKTDSSLAVYGEMQVRKALAMGAVETLLLSESLRKYRIFLKCESCDYKQEMTISEDELENFEPPKCSKCDTSNLLIIEDKIDIIDELSDLAEKTGSDVRLISLDSEEGDSLHSAFNGIAGILRYSLDL
jgi:peptide chain release factor subunit 1